MRRILTLVGATISLGLLTAIPAVTAQTMTTILIPSATLQSGPPPPLGDRVGAITAMVDGQTCAAISLMGPSNTNSNGDKVLILGTADQPAACSQEGQEIVFTNAAGQMLAVRLTVSPGMTLTLQNLAPLPPGQGNVGVPQPTSTQSASPTAAAATPTRTVTTTGAGIRPPDTGSAGLR